MSSDISSLIESIFNHRRKENPNLSLRAFAEALDISPSFLSEIFNRKRNPSKKLVRRILAALDSNDDQEDRIRKKIVLQLDINTLNKRIAKYRQVSHEEFEQIGAWYHFAIINLVETKNFVNDPAWIADRLGLSVGVARKAVETLINHRYLTISNDTLKAVDPNIETPSGIPSAALREMQRQNLQHGLKALEAVPLALRDITSMYIPTDPAKLPLAKQMIADFQYKLDQTLSDGNRTEVYALNMQLIPLSKVATT